MFVVAVGVSFTNSSVIGGGLVRITNGWEPSAHIPSASGAYRHHKVDPQNRILYFLLAQMN